MTNTKQDTLYAKTSHIWADITHCGTVLMMSIPEPPVDLEKPIIVPISSIADNAGFIQFVCVGIINGEALFRANGSIPESCSNPCEQGQMLMISTHRQEENAKHFSASP